MNLKEKKRRASGDKCNELNEHLQSSKLKVNYKLFKRMMINGGDSYRSTFLAQWQREVRTYESCVANLTIGAMNNKQA